MLMKYPSVPVPYTIEIELTNFCNAKCVFCSNSISKRKKQFIDTEELYNFLLEQRNKMDDNWFNHIIGKNIFPKVVLGGLGEPLLHKEVFDIIKFCKSIGFRVQLITNGLLLDLNNINNIINSNLDEIAISLHTLNPEIYYNITGLNIENVLPKVEMALKLFKNSKTKVELWRIKPPYYMKQENLDDKIAYTSFVSKYNYISVLGPSEPWSRDSTIESLCERVNDDENGEIWCHKIYFTYNISCNGDIVLCCNDYNRISVNLGNVFEEDCSNVNKIKMKILKRELNPDICSKCRRWKDVEYEQIVKKYNIK